jgi:hypothetical protein
MGLATDSDLISAIPKSTEPARAAYTELDRDPATTPHRRAWQKPRPMSVLQRVAQTGISPIVITQ